MENPFKNFFPEKSENTEDLNLIREFITKIEDYQNGEDFDILVNGGLTTSPVSKEELARLKEMLKNTSDEDIRSTIDAWLIENDNSTPVLAVTRNKFGLQLDEEQHMSYPERGTHPEFEDDSDGDSEKNIILAKEDYVARMKRALHILQEDFNKKKLDMFYLDTLGNPQFDLKLSELEKELQPLIERERKEKIKTFLDNLR